MDNLKNEFFHPKYYLSSMSLPIVEVKLPNETLQYSAVDSLTSTITNPDWITIIGGDSSDEEVYNKMWRRVAQRSYINAKREVQGMKPINWKVINMPTYALSRDKTRRMQVGKHTIRIGQKKIKK
jgi:hypothetical protein